MAKYKRCPRCELNWIPEDEDYCDVCKAELKIGDASLLEDEEEELCPVCHSNYLEPGETICSYCAQKNPSKDQSEDDEHVYNIDDTDRSEEDLENVSFDELAEEESWADYDEPFDDNESFDDADYEGDDDEEEDEEFDSTDELEDDFNYDIDSVEDIDDEEEEDDDKSDPDND